MKKIFILTEYFPPSYASTGNLLEQLADGLGTDFDVMVVTSIKRNGYDESKKNYKTSRLSPFRLDKNRKSGKIINGIIFLFSCFFYVLLCTKKDSILLIVSNPPYLPVIGHFFYKLRKQNFIYLIHDQYPEIAVNLGYLKEGSFAVKLWKRLNIMIFSTSWKTIALGDMIGKHISGLYPEISRRENLVIIPNWSDKNSIYPFFDKKSSKQKCGFDDKFVVRYSGNIGLFHGLEVIIETAALLNGMKDIVFHLTGGGGKKDALIEKAGRLGLANMIFGDYVAYEELNSSLNSADIALVTLDKKASNLSVPSKFYGLIAAGLPVIAVMDDNTDLAEEIRQFNVGFVCDSDPYEISGKIRLLYEDAEMRKNFSNNAQKLFLKKYDKDIIMTRYKDMLNGL